MSTPSAPSAHPMPWNWKPVITGGVPAENPQPSRSVTARIKAASFRRKNSPWAKNKSLAVRLQSQRQDAILRCAHKNLEV